MSSVFSQQLIDEVIAFHGHYCPGLGIGIRASEYALRELNANKNTNLMAVVETDMCAVDAIQYLTSCTFGKGNLIHKDYGKTAFNFYNLETNEGIRLVYNDRWRKENINKLASLMKKVDDGAATEEEKHELQSMRDKMKEDIAKLPLEELFSIEKAAPRPKSARIMESIVCEHCGENTMESRIRRFSGKYVCIPCFTQVEQKI